MVLDEIGYFCVLKSGLMLRTIVVPDNQNVSIHIPSEYIGRQIEVLLYATDEVKSEKLEDVKKKKPSDYLGTLSSENASLLLKDIEQHRKEWERDI